MANYSFKPELPEAVNGVVEGHNLLRGKPHTKIYEGISGLTFRKCNLTNCDAPADAKVDDCLVGHVSFCSHLHPKWFEKGYISECSENCEHLTETDEIVIDGQVIDSVNHYADKVVI